MSMDRAGSEEQHRRRKRRMIMREQQKRDRAIAIFMTERGITDKAIALVDIEWSARSNEYIVMAERAIAIERAVRDAHVYEHGAVT